MSVSVRLCLCASLCVSVYGVHKAEQELQCPVFEEGCAALPPTSSENKGVRGQGTLLEKRKTPKNRFTQENRQNIDCRRFSVPRPSQIVCRNFVLPGHILGRCRSPWRRWRPKSWAYYHEGSRQMAKLRWMRRRTCSTVHSFGSPSSSTLWEGGEGGAGRGGGEDWEGGGDERLGLPSPSVFTRFSVRSRAASAWWGICHINFKLSGWHHNEIVNNNKRQWKWRVSLITGSLRLSSYRWQRNTAYKNSNIL